MAELARALQSQNIWFNRNQYLSAEIKLAQFKLGITPSSSGDAPAANNIKQNKSQPKKEQPKKENKAANMVKELKQQVQNASNDSELSNMLDRVLKLEKENQEIRSSLEKALSRLELLEKNGAFVPAEKEAVSAAPAKTPAAKKVDSDAEESDDDDDDFFASDSEDEAAEELKAKRVAEYNARKAAKEEKKGKVIAKSSLTLDVKPWDDETNLDELLVEIKKIELDGLVWGTGQKKPLAFGIFKLVVVCVVEDDKVSTDDLVEKIEAFEDHVQSVDIAAFQKI